MRFYQHAYILWINIFDRDALFRFTVCLLVFYITKYPCCKWYQRCFASYRHLPPLSSYYEFLKVSSFPHSTKHIYSLGQMYGWLNKINDIPVNDNFYQNAATISLSNLDTSRTIRKTKPILRSNFPNLKSHLRFLSAAFLTLVNLYF